MGEDTALEKEVERVLGNQMDIIQNQQKQASQIIRVGLTTAGLLLTLISIVFSSGFVDPSFFELTSGSQLSNKFVLLAMVVISMLLVFLAVINIFGPAFAVLNPQAADSHLYKFLLYSTYSIDEEQPSEDETMPEVEKGNKLEVSTEYTDLRTGIDSDKAMKLLEQDDINQDILEYNIGCIRGNEKIIYSNREHLVTIYRSSSLLAIILTMLVFNVLLSIFSLNFT